MFNPTIGRFLTLDPLTSKYPQNSPYSFSANRVIDGVELEGLEYVRRIHTVDGEMNVISTKDIIYYKMSNEDLIMLGGTPSGGYYAAGFGPEGRGVKHEYYFVNGESAGKKPVWDLSQGSIAGSLGSHGIYSGAGSITHSGRGTDYDFSWSPIDQPDAIAKRHDINYSIAAGYQYQGFAEDTRTLGADLQMINEVNNFLMTEKTQLVITGRTTVIESIVTAMSQKSFISILADYKEWKNDYMIKNKLDPKNPNDMQKVSINNLRDRINYIFSNPFKIKERIINSNAILKATKPTPDQ
jgi:hypothetical protein